MSGVLFLAVRTPEHVKLEGIGEHIEQVLEQGSAYYVAVVPELVRDYEILFYSKDILAEALIAFKDKAEVNDDETCIDERARRTT